jgi:pyruvate/2-oxoglutarate dehydrogenase complex dihydrolipoamide dehydrogenase (E3) component
MKKNKVDWIKGYGRLAGPGKVEVTTDGGKQILEAKNIVLATGSEARMLPGLKPVLAKKVVGRNDPCPCGSGKKYKKCCGS